MRRERRERRHGIIDATADQCGAVVDVLCDDQQRDVLLGVGAVLGAGHDDECRDDGGVDGVAGCAGGGRDAGRDRHVGARGSQLCGADGAAARAMLGVWRSGAARDGIDVFRWLRQLQWVL